MAVVEDAVTPEEATLVAAPMSVRARWHRRRAGGQLTDVGGSDDVWFWEQAPLPRLDAILKGLGATTETEMLSLFLLLRSSTVAEREAWLNGLADDAPAKGWYVRARDLSDLRWHLTLAGPAGFPKPGFTVVTRAPDDNEACLLDDEVAGLVGNALEGECVETGDELTTSAALWELTRRRLQFEQWSSAFYIRGRLKALQPLGADEWVPLYDGLVAMDDLERLREGGIVCFGDRSRADANLRDAHRLGLNVHGYFDADSG